MGIVPRLPFKLLSGCIKIPALNPFPSFWGQERLERGEVPKWPYRARLEIELSCEEQGTWVRIPPSPPEYWHDHLILLALYIAVEHLPMVIPMK